MDLIRQGDQWMVVDPKRLSHSFSIIESACEYLEAEGVDDREIDRALTDMFAKGHNLVHFGVNGLFIFSDKFEL